MTKRDTDNLNRLLGEWLDRTLPPVSGQPQADDLLRMAGDLPQPGSLAEAGPRRRKRRLIAWVAVGAAAVLVAILAEWMIGAGRQTAAPPKSRELPHPRSAPAPLQNGRQSPAAVLLAQLDNEELLRRLDLLDSLDSLFEKKWTWMVESGDCVDVKVGGDAASEDSAPVAARLAILARQSPDQEFRVEEKTFILTREQQLVETVLQNGATRKLRFWAFAIDDGLYTYDVDLTVDKPQPLSISTSGVVLPGKATQILSVRHDQYEYRAVLLLIPRPRTPSITSKKTL